MNRGTTRRLRNIDDSLRNAPIPVHIEREAYEHFQETGELPEQRRLACEIVRRCREGLGDVWVQLDEPARIRHFIARHEEPTDSLMHDLYREATLGDGFVQMAARTVLKALAAIGRDVTQPQFVGSELEAEMPDWGYVGVWLLGFPERLAVQPYVQQAKRLFRRYEGLRERAPQNEDWFAELGTSIRLFRDAGELPRDELLRECVLADVEFVGLLQHKLGEGDPELMAALDSLAQAAEGDRDERLAVVQGIARAGWLAPREA